MKISRQVAIFGLILPFYVGQKWVKICTNRSGQAGGEVTPPPPQSGQPDPFFHSFFFTPSLMHYCTVAWVTWPERPKGVKDVVKQARRAQSRLEGPLPGSRAPEGPLDF